MEQGKLQRPLEQRQGATVARELDGSSLES